jgi:hypothetical protein
MNESRMNAKLIEQTFDEIIAAKQAASSDLMAITPRNRNTAR